MLLDGWQSLGDLPTDSQACWTKFEFTSIMVPNEHDDSGVALMVALVGVGGVVK